MIWNRGRVYDSDGPATFDILHVPLHNADTGVTRSAFIILSREDYRAKMQNKRKTRSPEKQNKKETSQTNRQNEQGKEKKKERKKKGDGFDLCVQRVLI